MATMRLNCDHCGAVRQAKPGVSLEVLRRNLVEVGWYVDASANLDICPLEAEAYVERVL